jgi:hypothetical protein
VASQPPRLADHDAVAATASRQPPSDTAQQRASELLERLAAQRREFDQSLQQQQAAFQATLREEVDIRVALQTCVHMRSVGSGTKHLRSCDQHRRHGTKLHASRSVYEQRWSCRLTLRRPALTGTPLLQGGPAGRERRAAGPAGAMRRRRLAPGATAHPVVRLLLWPAAQPAAGVPCSFAPAADPHNPCIGAAIGSIAAPQPISVLQR